MTQPPSYVVRPDAGGELKLLLVRDPRATHVASKISPMKKEPPSQVAPLASSAPTSSAPTASSSVFIQQLNKSPRKIKAFVTQPSSSISVLSPTSLTQAASEAMTLVRITSASQSSGGTLQTMMGKKDEGGRVKGGKIVKLQQSKAPPVVVPKKSSKSPTAAPLISAPHTTSPNTNKPPQPRISPSHTDIPKPAPKRAVPNPKHQLFLPVSRIRTIMRTNVQSTHNTHNVSQDSVALVTKATELFIAQLAKEAHKISMATAKRDVAYGHLATSVRKTDRTTFLHDVIPEKVLVSDYLASLGNHPDHTHNTLSSDTSN